MFKVNLKSLESIKKEIAKEITNEIFTKSQENLVEPNANGRIISDRGILLRSGQIFFNPNGAQIIYAAPHAEPTEYGSKPHMPPVEPLKKWARRKLGLTPKEADKVAWAISKKIAKEGTTATRFFRNAIDEISNKYKGSGIKLKLK